MDSTSRLSFKAQDLSFENTTKNAENEQLAEYNCTYCINK